MNLPDMLALLAALGFGSIVTGFFSFLTGRRAGRASERTAAAAETTASATVTAAEATAATTAAKVIHEGFQGLVTTQASTLAAFQTRLERTEEDLKAERVLRLECITTLAITTSRLQAVETELVTVKQDAQELQSQVFDVVRSVAASTAALGIPEK